MLWLILEASAAFFVLVFIVWWTMFSGRKGGELDDRLEAPEPPKRD